LKPGDIIYVPPAVSPGSEVFVFGEVNVPGRISLKKDAKISEILARAGGLPKENYSAGNIVVVRGNIKNPEVIEVDFKKIFDGDLTQDIQMKHRDIIFVSSTSLKKWKDMSDKILSFLTITNMAASNIISWDEASVILRGQKKR
ncbi:MAG: SLBB domain-containing protein, partial [Nitrospinae bacterium]|nr:SLBB domain-containing protein [Nitrospinota bacterium]